MSDRPIESQQTKTSATQGNGEQQKKKELIAYIRVSSIGQSLEVQRDKMLALGVNPEYIFEEKYSGVDSNCPVLKEAIRFARKASVFVITKIDRLARSATDLLTIFQELERKSVALRVIDQNMCTPTSVGRAMLQMLAVFAEFETASYLERQSDGMTKVKAKGVHFGCKTEATPAVVAEIKRLKGEGKLIWHKTSIRSQ